MKKEKSRQFLDKFLETIHRHRYVAVEARTKHFTVVKPYKLKLASYLRSAPGVDSSNKSTRITRTRKFVRRLSNGLLIQGVTHFKTAYSVLRAWSESLVQRKKGTGKVRMGIVRQSSVA